MAEEVTMTLLIASLTLIGALVASQPQQAVAPMGRVSGRVIEDGTNTPVAGARVFVGLDAELATPVDPSPETVTDRDGRYHLDALPAGRYYIAAEKAGFAPPMEPSTVQRFEVSAGQAPDGLTVVMRRGGVFTGRVLDSIGQPLAQRRRDGVVETPHFDRLARGADLVRRTAADAVRSESNQRPR